MKHQDSEKIMVPPMSNVEFNFLGSNVYMLKLRAYLVFNFFFSDWKVLNKLTEARFFSPVCACIPAHVWVTQAQV